MLKMIQTFYPDVKHGSFRVENLNTLPSSMPFSCAGGAIGAPGAGEWVGIQLNNESDKDSAIQFAFSTDSAEQFTRRCVDGAWSAWAGRPASQITVKDVEGYYGGDDLEEVLAEIGAVMELVDDLANSGVDTTARADIAELTSQLAEKANKTSVDAIWLAAREMLPVDLSAVYGAKWGKVESPELTRLSFLKGVTVTPGLDATPGVNDLETSALFDWPEVTDSYGNVFIRIPKIYLRKIDTPTSLTWYASRMPFEGCYLPKCFWDFENGKELDYVLVGKYKASLSADGLRLESKPDVFPLYGRNIVQFRTLAQANNAGGLKGYQQLDIHVIDLLQTLFVIQNATLDSQSKAAGYTTGQYAATHLAVVAETAVNRIIVPNATANLYEVGQTIGIGTSQGGQQVAADRLITAIEVYDASNKAVVFDGSPVNIAVGNMLYNTAYKNGFSAALTSKFASKISATSGKHPFVWQGIESLWGDIWQFVDGVNINNRQAWVCENADQYTSNVFAEPYKQLSYVNGSTDGYSMAMGFDAERPYASFPVSAGGSSSKFYSDYYYSSEGQRVARVGGDWTDGSHAGLFYWTLNAASSTASVHVGGRLLKKPL